MTDYRYQETQCSTGINENKEMLWCSHGMWNHNAIVWAFYDNVTVSWIQQKCYLKHKHTAHHLGWLDLAWDASNGAHCAVVVPVSLSE